MRRNGKNSVRRTMSGFSWTSKAPYRISDKISYLTQNPLLVSLLPIFVVETKTIEIEVEVPVKIAEKIENGETSVTPTLDLD
jgi:hypothetical protein